MSLSPYLNLTGDSRSVKVSASDVANPSECGRFLALKTRPAVRTADGWSRLFSPWDKRLPFALGDVIELVIEARAAEDSASYGGLRDWLLHSIDQRGVHRLLRSYVRQAVENILEAHEAIESEIGSLRLLALNPHVGPADRMLTVWGPLYATEDGIREIHRFRFGTVHDKDDATREVWSDTAAFVAASYRRGEPPERVRVVEIGAVDGSSMVIFDGTAGEARARFAVNGRRRAAAVTEEDHVVPCRSCGDCKAAGSCRALVAVDGMLGQPGRGHSSRSVSPSELEQYLRCPGQWLLDTCAHLPKEHGSGEGATRGYAVHRWLAAAHTRQRGCSPADLPHPGTGLGLADGVLTEAEYEIAHPFLSQHVSQCPLSAPEAEVVAVEIDMYGYDHDAEVVPVTRPDLVYRVDDVLVVREVKTAREQYGSGKDEAYDRHLQIPFLITMLNSGLLAQYGARAGAIEVELLTSTQHCVWSWDPSDPTVAAVAAGTIRRAVEGWHTDSAWDTHPGPYCAWCAVREWCPDRDLWQERASATEGAETPTVTTGSDEDAPPF